MLTLVSTMADLRPLREIGGEGSLSLSSEQLALAEACRLRPRCNYKTLSRYSPGSSYWKKGFIGNKCTRTLIYLKRYMVHGFMQCPHISWFARLDQYQAVCCIAIHGRRTAFKKKLYLPHHKHNIPLWSFFFLSFFLSLINNLLILKYFLF